MASAQAFHVVRPSAGPRPAALGTYSSWAHPVPSGYIRPQGILGQRVRRETSLCLPFALCACALPAAGLPEWVMCGHSLERTLDVVATTSDHKVQSDFLAPSKVPKLPRAYCVPGTPVEPSPDSQTSHSLPPRKQGFAPSRSIRWRWRLRILLTAVLSAQSGPPPSLAGNPWREAAEGRTCGWWRGSQ